LFGVLEESRIARFGRFYKEVGGFIWRVSECKKLVGAVTVGDGVGCGGISTWSIKITRKPNLFFLYRFLFSDIP